MSAKYLLPLLLLLKVTFAVAQSKDTSHYWVEGFTSYVLTEGPHNDTPWVARHWEFDTQGRLIHESSSKSNPLADQELREEHYTYRGDSILSNDIKVRLNEAGKPISYYRTNELNISATYDTAGNLKTLIYEPDTLTNMIWSNGDLISLDDIGGFGRPTSHYHFSYDTNKIFNPPFRNFTAVKGLYNWPFGIFNFQAFSRHVLIQQSINGGFSEKEAIRKYTYTFANGLEKEITVKYTDEYMDNYPVNIFEFNIRQK